MPPLRSIKQSVDAPSGGLYTSKEATGSYLQCKGVCVCGAEWTAPPHTHWISGSNPDREHI